MNTRNEEFSSAIEDVIEECNTWDIKLTLSDSLYRELISQSMELDMSEYTLAVELIDEGLKAKYRNIPNGDEIDENHF